jgi:hypothetical protein
MRIKLANPTFKSYIQAQPSLIPPSWDELIPAEHVVRVVNLAIDEIDLEPLMKQYQGGGTSSYHPRMMLKVVVYAYTQRIYSSRQIAKAVRVLEKDCLPGQKRYEEQERKLAGRSSYSKTDEDATFFNREWLPDRSPCLRSPGLQCLPAQTRMYSS